MVRDPSSSFLGLIWGRSSNSDFPACNLTPNGSSQHEQAQYSIKTKIKGSLNHNGEFLKFNSGQRAPLTLTGACAEANVFYGKKMYKAAARAP